MFGKKGGWMTAVGIFIVGLIIGLIIMAVAAPKVLYWWWTIKGLIPSQALNVVNLK